MQPNHNPAATPRNHAQPAATFLPATTPRPPRPCPACCGEGYLVHVGAPGYFDDLEGCWMPSETLDPCDSCRGTGRQLASDGWNATDSDDDPGLTEPPEPEPPLDF
jgi:hypothetical protein